MASLCGQEGVFLLPSPAAPIFSSSGMTPQGWGARDYELMPWTQQKSGEDAGACPRELPQAERELAGKSLKPGPTCTAEWQIYHSSPIQSSSGFPFPPGKLWQPWPGLGLLPTPAWKQLKPKPPSRVPVSLEAIFLEDVDGLRESPSGCKPTVLPSLPAWVNRSHPGCSPPPS